MATANAVARLGGIPVFADCEADTGLLCAQSVGSLITKKTRAIIPVHLYGALVDMRAMRDLADHYDLKLIEDAAHCVEGERDGYKPGNLSDAACFSFYATKNLTCGEGGAISTNHDDLASWLRSARIHGMSSDATQRHSGTFKHYDQEFVGTKANMNDLQAALLIPQMKHIATRRAERERIAHLYETKLRKISDVDFPQIPTGCISAYHLQTAWIPAQLRDTIVMDLRDQGIGAAVNYRPVHMLSAWKNRTDCLRIPLPNTERIGACTLTLPLYPGLRDDEVNTVVDALEASLHKAKQQAAA
jgi:UDP-4-amino-4-deoxy-L-arabinose-oxoglutarate aminotransferase